jgi:hypothetical protein
MNDSDGWQVCIAEWVRIYIKKAIISRSVLGALRSLFVCCAPAKNKCIALMATQQLKAISIVRLAAEQSVARAPLGIVVFVPC